MKARTPLDRLAAAGTAAAKAVLPNSVKRTIRRMRRGHTGPAPTGSARPARPQPADGRPSGNQPKTVGPTPALSPDVRWVQKEEFLDPQAYLAAAERAREAKQTVLAHTMLRCAQTLGADVPDGELEATLLSDDQLKGRGSLYQRNMRVADLLAEHFGDGALSVVDVGGHTGIMSHMAPETRYLLCEPSINCMYSHDLVEAGRKFDVTLSIHTFEHIPADLKPSFFESLVDISTKGVILCNPTDTGDAEERQRFLLDVYGPLGWIVDHLQCDTPTIELCQDLAARHDLDLHVYPNGNRFLSMTMFAMEHFSNATGDPEMKKKCGKLIRYINSHRHLQDAPQAPRDYAFVFIKKNAV